MKKILLTGAAGFIGANTVRHLLAQGYEVVGIDNMNDYYDPGLKYHRIQALKADMLQFVEGDIEDYDLLDSLFETYKFDAVINLAARAGVRYSMENPYIYVTTNLTGTLNLVELMARHKVGKLVIASTSSLYAGQKMPFVESLPVNEPISPYAASKKAAEAMAYTYHYQYDIDVSILRYFTVYGPASRPDMGIYRFVDWIQQEQPIQLFGDGEQSRDFTYVDDISLGTIKALKPVGYEVINLGGGNSPITINHIINQIGENLGKKPIIEYLPFNKADMKSTWADISKAKALLDWEPQVSIEEGLRRTVEWHLAYSPTSPQVK